MEDKKVFDDFPRVDCYDCQHYWRDTCDGVPVGSEKPCNSFVATRRVDLLAQIKSLRKRVDGLNWAFIFLAISILIHYLVSLHG
jgi:hypothetical protein